MFVYHKEKNCAPRRLRQEVWYVIIEASFTINDVL